jgi:hypothetical protein
MLEFILYSYLVISLIAVFFALLILVCPFYVADKIYYFVSTLVRN